jgi:Domain of Unknown Function (DUF1206)
MSVDVDERLRGAKRASREAADSSWVEGLGRYGLVAKGISYGLVGVLAAALALAGDGEATSREGAFEQLAQEGGYGKPLLVALALGFLAYAAWRIVQAIFDRDREGSGAKAVAKRAGYAGRAVIYVALAIAALQLLDGTGGGSAGVEEKSVTARILEYPAGRWFVGLVGLAFVAAALFNAYRGLTQKFEEKWDVAEMSSAERTWLPRLSTAGLFARFVVFGLIGWFLVKAAYEHDPKEAIGLDGALQKVIQASYGPVLLTIVAAGLLCYALFCFAEARYRRV